MNTNQLKRFAREARIKLLDQIERKLEYVLTHDSAELRGKQLEIAELRKNINQYGKAHVIDTVAYTWFNRLMALRFMDANGYNVPKVVTPAPGMTNPEILQNAIAGHVEEKLNLDRRYLNDLLDNKTASTDPRTEAYRILLVATCNSLHATMPFMFEPISDYTELLLPDDLLSGYSIVTDIRGGMRDEDCLQEELIGWLYQFYIAQKKDDVFEKLKKNVKITPENIPAATQLFTPRWIVRYMVENTLGKLWLTLRPESRLWDHMSYYIESPEGNETIPVPEDLLQTSITADNPQLTTIKFLDPCVGSGHVLVYAFDLLAHIYEEEGYNRNEIPSLILTNNLFGIDIDERAAQLAAFALTMKAQSYYNRFLRKPVQPHIIALENIRIEAFEEAVKLPVKVNRKSITRYPDLSLYLLAEADNFGSLIQIEPDEVNSIQIKNGSIWQNQQIKLKQQAAYLSNKYHCVVTNPPYMGGKGMNGTLKSFVEKYYLKSKSDLMACFMERCLAFATIGGKVGMINQHSWMFLSSYEDLRPYLVDNIQFESMLHLGPRTFPEIGGEVVQNTTFVLGNYKPVRDGIFIRLTEFDNAKEKEIKTIESLQNQQCSWLYVTDQKGFEKIPTNIICYWISPHELALYQRGDLLENYSHPAKGIDTGENEYFLRLWHEVSFNRIDTFLGSGDWVPYNKGGEFRRWYGNREYILRWNGSESELRSRLDWTKKKPTLRNKQHWFKKGFTWTTVSGGGFSARYCEEGALFDNGGCTLFADENLLLLGGLINSKVADRYLEFLAPTLNFQPGDIGLIAIETKIFNLKETLSNIVQHCIDISKSDWDSSELSWSFQINELLIGSFKRVSDSLSAFKSRWTKLFTGLYLKECELNKILIEAYGLENEISPKLHLGKISILNEVLENRKRRQKSHDSVELDEWNPIWNEINSSFNHLKPEDLQLPYVDKSVLFQFVNYFIGICFGRFSVDKPGLILSNQGETIQDFLKTIPLPTFMPDEDNVIPVLDDEWFSDDIVKRFRTFLKVAFTEDYLEENIRYIEETIGKDIRKYFVRDFYADHIKRYKKRPIYWMFTSPKGHFKALIYMHRYTPDLCNKVLNDYLQPFIGKLDTTRQTQVAITLRADVSTREKTKATQRIDTLVAMLKDCRAFEKTLFEVATRRIEIDLDDGVKVNYQKFKEVLVPIKGLEKEED